MHGRGLIARLAVLVLASTLVLAGCGGGDDDDSSSAAGEQSFVGELEGTDALLAVVRGEDGGATAYICDSVLIAEWFDGELDPDGGEIAAASGDVIDVTIDGDTAEGVVRLTDDTELDFEADRVSGDAGLYEAIVELEDSTYLAGWIVDGEGRQEGAFGAGAGGAGGGFNQGFQGQFNQGQFNQGGFQQGLQQGFQQGQFNQGFQGQFNQGQFNQGQFNQGQFNQGGFQQGQFNQGFAGGFQGAGGGFGGNFNVGQPFSAEGDQTATPGPTTTAAPAAPTTAPPTTAAPTTEGPTTTTGPDGEQATSPVLPDVAEPADVDPEALLEVLENGLAFPAIAPAVELDEPEEEFDLDLPGIESVLVRKVVGARLGAGPDEDDASDASD